MRALVLALAMLGVLLPVRAEAHITRLSVYDGEYFYDTGSDCNGDTDNGGASGAKAVRSWEVGLPQELDALEVLGGRGCKGGPRTWRVTVTTPMTVAGEIKYGPNMQVGGACCNDVHLHVYDGNGLKVATTLVGVPQPAVAVALPIRYRSFSLQLGPGTYTIREDVASGSHTIWLTRLLVTEIGTDD